jgi:hypothetical protein
MARAHNPFAPKEASTLQTPWGDFEVASPNKTRTELLSAVQKRAEALSEDADLGDAALIAIEVCAAGLLNGDEFAKAASSAWDSDQITIAELQGAASFVSDELQSGVAEGNG